jgi:hypothetical protein
VEVAAGGESNSEPALPGTAVCGQVSGGRTSRDVRLEALPRNQAVQRVGDKLAEGICDGKRVYESLSASAGGGWPLQGGVGGSRSRRLFVCAEWQELARLLQF